MSHDKEEKVESKTKFFSKTGAAFEMSSSSDVHHRFVVSLGDDAVRRLFQEESEMEDIRNRHFPSHRVQHLKKIRK